MQQPNLNQFFPGLGGTLPPAVRHASDTGAVGAGALHRFDANPMMNLDPSAAKGELKMTDVTKVANSKPNHPAGCPMATTEDLIAYGLKAGKIRVIHSPSASKAVLKGHSQPIVDMAFRETTLASSADDGLCLLWDISLQPDESGNQVVDGAETMRLRSPAGHGIQRIQFHPKDQDLLFIANGPSLAGVRLDHALWMAYTGLSDKEAGLSLDHAAAFRTPVGAHSQTITEFAFSDDGNFVATVGSDGILNVFACDFSAKSGELRLVQRKELGMALSFVCFAGWAVVCGSTNIEELMLISSQGAEISRVRFGSMLPGAAVRLRAQAVPSLRCIVLCDQNMPLCIVVRANETGIKTACAFRTAVSVLAFSVRQTVEDSIVLGTIGENLIQLAELSRLSTILPPIPSSPGPQASAMVPPPAQIVVPQPRTNVVNVVQPRSVVSSQGAQVPPMQQHMSPAPAVVASSAGPSIALGDLERLLDDKLGALAVRMESQMKERADKDNQRMRKLLEEMSNSLVALREAMQADLLAQFTSPAFVDSLASAVRAGVGAADNKSVEKSIKSIMPMVVKDSYEGVMSKVTANLNKAFDDAFRAHLVPAFEAGCRDLVNQMDEALSSTTGNTGGESATKAKPSKRQVEEALAQQNYSSALQMAIANGDQSLLTATCSKAPLTQLFENGSLPQTLLVSLVGALAGGIASEPSKRLEWIRELAVAIDPGDPDVAAILPGVARQARMAIESNRDKLGQVKQSLVLTTEKLLSTL